MVRTKKGLDLLEKVANLGSSENLWRDFALGLHLCYVHGGLVVLLAFVERFSHHQMYHHRLRVNWLLFLVSIQ